MSSQEGKELDRRICVNSVIRSMMLDGVVVCNELSGKVLHRYICVHSVFGSGSLGCVMISTLVRE